MKHKLTIITIISIALCFVLLNTPSLIKMIKGSNNSTSIPTQGSNMNESNKPNLNVPSDNSANNTNTASDTTAPIYGLAVRTNSQEEIDFSLSIMNDLGVDRTRIWENWILRETAPGKENWKGLDLKINGFFNGGKKIILIIKPVGVFNNATSWYCENESANENSCVFKQEYEDDFAKYIDSIVKRYPGKIDKIQFQNEWDSDFHFVGSAQDYTKYANILFDTVKNVDPEITVSLGPITKWPLVYIAGCQLDLLTNFYSTDGKAISESQRQSWCNSDEAIQRYERVKYVLANARYDLVDIHLYADPENWAQYITAYEHLADENSIQRKPIIVTEFGGPNENDQRYNAADETFQSKELKKYMDKIRELPILEAYYFRMIEGEGSGINHPLSGLMKMENGNPVEKQNYFTFKNEINND